MVRTLRLVYWRIPDDVGLLLYQLSKAFLISLGLSTLIHLLLLAFGPNMFNSPNGSPPEPSHVRFFPRRDLQLTRPIELRKVPLPKRQPVHREVRIAPARIVKAPEIGRFSTHGLVSRLSLPSPTLTADPIDTDNIGPVLGPMVPIGRNPIDLTRHAARQVDLHLDLLDVSSLDIGRYQAVVIQDPEDRQGIKGFVKFGMAMSTRAAHTMEYLEAEGHLVQTTDALIDALNDFTGLQAEVIREVSLDDKRLLELPILVVPVGIPNEAEKENLVRYLLGGGFIMGGISIMEGELFEGLEKYGGLVRGRDFWSEALPEDHAIFGSFFDIHGGVGSNLQMKRDSAGSLGSRHVDTITGYFIKGRLVGVDPIDTGQWVDKDTPIRAIHDLKFAINVVVYALTQEGSLTQRLMQAK